MKVHFPFRTLSLAIIFAFAAGCYSVEFYPVAEYPNLRRAEIDDVEIRTSAPPRPYDKLGHLVIKDPAADLNNRNFRRFLRGQARDHGAEGAWIIRRRLYTNSMITGSTDDQRHYVETGQLELEGGVLTVMLFNYKRTPEAATTEE